MIFSEKCKEAYINIQDNGGQASDIVPLLFGYFLGQKWETGSYDQFAEKSNVWLKRLSKENREKKLFVFIPNEYEMETVPGLLCGYFQPRTPVYKGESLSKISDTIDIYHAATHKWLGCVKKSSLFPQGKVSAKDSARYNAKKAIYIAALKKRRAKELAAANRLKNRDLEAEKLAKQIAERAVAVEQRRLEDIRENRKSHKDAIRIIIPICMDQKSLRKMLEKGKFEESSLEVYRGKLVTLISEGKHSGRRIECHEKMKNWYETSIFSLKLSDAKLSTMENIRSTENLPAYHLEK